jgi:multiple sugar transport system substrate-binding protein
VACGAPAAPSPTAAPARAPAPPAATPTAPAAAAEAPKAAPTQAAAAPTQAPTAAPASAASPTPAAAKPATQAPATLTVGAWGNNPQIEILNDIAAAYEKARPNTKINKQFAGWTEYWQKLQTQIASNTAPDMIMMSVAYIGNFVAKGTVLNLDPYVAGQKLDLGKYIPVDVSTWQFGPKARVGGKGPLYALAFDASINSTFYYNKTLFDKAKIPLPTDSWTWEKDVLDAAKALTDAKNGQWGMIAPYTYDGTWTSMVWEYGGDTIDPTYAKGTLSEPSALAALKVVYDYVHTHKVSPPPTPNEQVNPFTTGKIAMNFSNCDCEISTFKSIKDFEWDVARWPKGPKGRVVELEPDGYSLAKATKQADQAFDLLKFTVYDDDGVLRQSKYGTFPARRDVAQSEEYLKSPGFPAGKRLQLMDVAEDARSNYFGRGWAEWTEKSQDALTQAWLGKKPIEAAAKDADEAITKVLSSLEESLY